jgi:hypothetical protein
MRLGFVCLTTLVALAGCPAEDDTADDDGADSAASSGTTGGDGATSMAPTTTDPDPDASGDAGQPTTTSVTTGPGTDTGPATDTEMGTTGASLCGAPIAELDSAVGILVGDYPPPPPTGGTGGTTVGTSDGGDGGGGIPDDTMRLRFANSPLTCEDPYGDFECEAFDKWWLTIHIPVEMQAPGVYDLADFDLGFSVVGAGMPPTCSGSGGGDGGGGGGWDGQLIIEQLDAGGIVGCLDGTNFFDFDANGSFAATNCSP